MRILRHPSHKMTAADALKLYKSGDVSEKLFMENKPLLNSRSLRLRPDDATSVRNCVEYYDINVFVEELNCSMLHIGKPAAVEGWDVECDEWVGSRNHGRFKTRSDVGVIKGKWFTGETGNKKLVTGKHFRKIKYLGKYEVWRPNPNLGKNKEA